MFPHHKTTRRDGLDHDGASALAIDALSFLSENPEHLQRFLETSGLQASDIRHAAAEPSFFLSLLDFMLSDEATLLAFAAHAHLVPERVAQARQTLGGPAGASFE